MANIKSLMRVMYINKRSISSSQNLRYKHMVGPLCKGIYNKAEHVSLGSSRQEYSTFHSRSLAFRTFVTNRQLL